MLSSASNEYLDASLNGRCDQGRLVDALRTLLGLYYQPNETTEERARQIALFVADLSDMSDDAIWWAMREWRRTQDRRPSPASLRQLCMMRRQEAMKEWRAMQPPATPVRLPYEPATPEQLAERKERMARIAAKNGFVRDRSGQLAFAEDLKEPERVPHWSETATADDPRHAALKAAREKALRAATLNASAEPF